MNLINKSLSGPFWGVPENFGLIPAFPYEACADFIGNVSIGPSTPGCRAWEFAAPFSTLARCMYSPDVGIRGP